MFWFRILLCAGFWFFVYCFDVWLFECFAVAVLLCCDEYYFYWLLLCGLLQLIFAVGCGLFTLLFGLSFDYGLFWAFVHKLFWSFCFGLTWLVLFVVYGGLLESFAWFVVWMFVFRFELIFAVCACVLVCLFTMILCFAFVGLAIFALELRGVCWLFGLFNYFGFVVCSIWYFSWCFASDLRYLDLAFGLFARVYWFACFWDLYLVTCAVYFGYPLLCLCAYGCLLGFCLFLYMLWLFCVLLIYGCLFRIWCWLW